MELHLEIFKADNVSHPTIYVVYNDDAVSFYKDLRLLPIKVRLGIGMLRVVFKNFNYS